MKPLIQQLSAGDHCSFVAKSFRTPHFEVGWHQHVEYELILLTEGSGLAFVGNYVGQFETGDIYFLGANLPHTFQKSHPDLVTSAVVVQFREDFWGREYLQLPEMRLVRGLFAASMQGLKVMGQWKDLLGFLLGEMEPATGMEKILLLGRCLQNLSEKKGYLSLSTSEPRLLNPKSRDCIDRVFQFTVDNFRDTINLGQVAAVACLSVPAFCNYFKRVTKKTYIDFLNETRIGYACHLLGETSRAVPDIAYESGYNTTANFHKQFLKVKKTTPLQYRKLYNSGIRERGGMVGIVGE